VRIDWTLSGCTQDDEREIERVWESLQPGFAARLSALPEGDADLLIGVYHQIDEPGERAWDVQAALTFPLGTSTAERTGDDLPQVLSGVVADLSQRLDTLDAAVAEPVDRRQRLESIRPFLERYHAANRSDTFFAFLQPVLRSFRGYVRRELAVLRSEDALAGEGVESSDVLDDALLRAWERFGQRPRDGRLDLWLLRLINAALAEHRVSVPHESLEARVSVPRLESQEAVEDDTWTEQAAYPESVELAETLAGGEGLGAWDDGVDTADSRQTGLARLLGGLSPEQRHALVLNAAEGYEPAEIADLQDRTVDEVLADLAIARDQLHRQHRRLEELEDVEDRLDNFPERRPYRNKG
jgi:DNA-directed RNA polymerase specialized sigma24 family protein